MKSKYTPYPYRRNMLRILSSGTLLTLLLVSSVARADQKHDVYHSEHPEIEDEEIVIEPRRDYDKTTIDKKHEAQRESRTDHDINSIIDEAGNRMQSESQIYKQDDPFAVSFETFIKDEKRNKALHSNNEVKETSAISDQANIIIDEDENLSKQEEQESQKIDYIFPPSKQDKDRFHEHEKRAKDVERTDNDELPEEIRLLFAWKESPTGKCSKDCGKGYKINRISCVDLKYNVRVENELCIKSNLPKPDDTSQEPCNEIDCPTQWLSVEFQECGSHMLQDGACHPSLYKRVQCTMVNGQGTLMYLDDVKCENSTRKDQQTIYHATLPMNTSGSLAQIQTDADIVDSTDYSIISADDANDILSNIDLESSRHMGIDTTYTHPHNEPFFHAGPWSECSGAPCGQLGVRSRILSCRLYLSRSSRFTELPEASCRSAIKPDTQEPCYMDCPPDNGKSRKNISETDINDGDNTDEVIYDLELTRYIWRSDNWTKCSAECLGGQHESIVECWDKLAQTLVDQSLCDQDTKPRVSTRVCNNTPCLPEWKSEPFSECSRQCGSAGVRTRSIVCVQQVPMRDGSSSSLLVSNDLCLQANMTIPPKIEPCNRFDCRPEWKVGPWSKCSKVCGDGLRNRTVICEQEFSSRDGPRRDHRILSPDLIEAVTLSSKEWYPGKSTQVPFQECYNEYKTIPALDEKCTNKCEEDFLIESDRRQDFQIQDAPRRKTITLKIGGKASLHSGKNLKIRCRIYNEREKSVKLRFSERVEWFKDGIKVFVDGSRIADKQYNIEEDSLFANDLLGYERDQYMADDPNSAKSAIKQTDSPQKTQTRRRNLKVRSSLGPSSHSYQFVPMRGGRFTLMKDNTLRVKRIQPDDAGIYTCSYGQSKESLDLRVISRDSFSDNDEKINVGF